MSQQARLTLNAARAVSGHAPPPAKLSPSRRRPQALNDALASHQNVSDPIENEMDVDPFPSRQHAHPPSPSLVDVWAGRTYRQERQDEDLCPPLGSPDQSEDEEDGGSGKALERPVYLSDDSDDEPPPPDSTPIHVNISARSQLTATYQLDAALAGMFPGV
jgi:hypothetical protein